MERSVTESRRMPQSRRVLYSALGVLVGVSLGALVVVGFDFMMAAR
jgi:LPS O-antigen subunit length determinant protein (WzzB/FepE family)